MANHYILDGGSGDGSAWNNAWDDLPATFVRGDTYYVGAGTYGGHTCDTAVSGTDLITIKGATVSEHGTETGWNAAYAVENTPASFTAFILFGLTSTGYWVLDGAVGSGNNPTSYGFRFLNAEAVFSCGGNAGVTVTNITVRHVYGQAVATDSEKEFMYCSTSCDHIANITIQYCLGDGFQAALIANGSAAATGCVFEYNYCINGFSSASHHGEQINPNGAPFDGLVCRYNVFDNCDGTAVIAANNSDLTNSFFYGNIFVDCVTGNGIIAGTSGGGMVSNVIYNNTFVQCTGAGWFVDGTGGSGNVCQNNLIFDMITAASGTNDYNAYFQATDTPPTETHGQISAADPFVNSASDYHLATNTDAGNNLGGTYDEDMDGVARATWSRGAYEFTSGATPWVRIYG